MTYALACGDVMPGCDARFEAESREELLGMVGPHAADVHGVTELTPDVMQAVESNIVQR